MARKLDMTWQASTHRWFQKTPRQDVHRLLPPARLPGDEGGSRAAANAWWDARLREIESVPPTEEDRQANAFKLWNMLQGWDQLAEDDRERLVDSLIGDGQYRKIRSQSEAMVESVVKPTPRDRTVAAQVETWKGLLRSACQSKQLSEGRYDAYCRRIRPFMEWIGPDSRHRRDRRGEAGRVFRPSVRPGAGGAILRRLPPMSC